MVSRAPARTSLAARILSSFCRVVQKLVVSRNLVGAAAVAGGVVGGDAGFATAPTEGVTADATEAMELNHVAFALSLPSAPSAAALAFALAACLASNSALTRSMSACVTPDVGAVGEDAEGSTMGWTKLRSERCVSQLRGEHHPAPGATHE